MVVDTPVVLVEVFSPSTEAIDRGRKWRDYARIPSLREYLLMGPEHPTVLIRRRADGAEDWRTEALGPDDELRLELIGFSCKMGKIYAGSGV